MKDEIIRFDDWAAVLRAEVPAEKQRTYREAIVKFRDLLGTENVLKKYKQ